MKAVEQRTVHTFWVSTRVIERGGQGGRSIQAQIFFFFLSARADLGGPSRWKLHLKQRSQILRTYLTLDLKEKQALFVENLFLALTLTTRGKLTTAWLGNTSIRF